MTKDLSDIVSDMDDAAKKAVKKIEKEEKLAPEQLELPGFAAVKDKKGNVHIVKPDSKRGLPKKKPEEFSKEEKIAELLERFCLKCGHLIYTKVDGEISHRYPKAEAWKYLADIAGYYTKVESTELHHHPAPGEYRVEAVCSLVRKKDDKAVSTVTMCAGSDESFVKAKGINSAFGLAITRAESRAVRSRLGHYMSCVGLEILPFEELTNQSDMLAYNEREV